MKPLLDLAEGVVLSLVAIPLFFIAGHTALTALDARPENEIVAFFARAADALTPQQARDVVVDQQQWQTALLAAAAWGLAVAFLVLVFRGLRALLAWAESRTGDASRGGVAG